MLKRCVGSLPSNLGEALPADDTRRPTTRESSLKSIGGKFLVISDHSKK